MIKVLIVDDDSLTRIGLLSSIEWEENGFQVIGEAESGEEALEMCRKQVPDIMLTDISMAEMNGIELIENIKEKGYDIKIIILTCYENFSFLHKALHMGVEDYILKVGMMPSDILKVLRKVKDKYWSGILPDKEKDKENNYEKLAAVESVIMGYVDDEEETKGLISRYSLHIPEKDYCVLQMKIVYQTENHNYHLNSILCKSILKVLLETAQKECIGEIVQCSEGEFAAALSLREEGEIRDSYYRLYLLAVNMIKLVKQSLGVDICIGISSLHYGYKKYRRAAEEASEAINSRFFRESANGVYELHRTIETDYQTGNKIIAEHVRNIYDFIISNNREELIRSVAAIENEIRENKMNMQTARMYFISAYICASGVLDGMDGMDFCCEEEMLVQGKQILFQGDSLNEIAEYVKNYLLLTADKFAGFKTRKKNAIITVVLNYVDSHYAEEISLDSIAERFHINTAYFCKLFKSVTGKTFIEYLTDKRIEVARKLLKTTDMKTYQVAEKTGFQTPEYFSKIFKKMTGYSPKEYKNL